MRSFYDRIVAFVFAVVLVLAGSAFANAGPFEDALPGFTTNSLATPPKPSMRSRQSAIRAPARCLKR